MHAPRRAGLGVSWGRAALDHAIANAAWYLGAITMAGALVYSFFLLRSSLTSNA